MNCNEDIASHIVADNTDNISVIEEAPKVDEIEPTKEENMVSIYGYENVNEFLLTLKESKAAYEIYQQAVYNWNKSSDHLEIVFDEAETIYEKLAKLKRIQCILNNIVISR